MPNDVQIEVFFEPHSDKYQFLVTTPQMNYTVSHRKDLFDTNPKYFSSVASEVRTVQSFKMATVVTSQAMIYDWHMVISHVTNMVAREFQRTLIECGGNDEYILKFIVRQTEYILRSKPAALWAEEAQNSGGGHGEQSKLRQLVPGLKENVKCPDCSDDTYPVELWSIIQHLNDGHKWTRDAIADWLETLDVDINFKVQDD